MKANFKKPGFTLIEILVICAVIPILALLSLVAYNGIQKRAAEVAVFSDLKAAAEQLGLAHTRSPSTFSDITELPVDFKASDEVIVRLASGYRGPVYLNLNPVQNGVLFYDICEELIADENYSTIHAREGGGTSTVVMNCDKDTAGNRMQITGWDTKKWHTPVTRVAIQEYIDSVDYDDWWTDRQDVVRGFYYELMNRFEAKGGAFPVTSFWDPWANEWSGVPKEELPPPTTQPVRPGGSYCVEAYHNRFPDDIYKVTEEEKIEAGSC